MSRARFAISQFAAAAYLTCFLISTGWSQGNDSPAPTSDAQEKILAAIRDYAADYISNLPNFTCEQVTLQFEAGKKPSHWQKGDTLTSRLIFNRGHEDRTLELVNNKPIRNPRRAWRTPLTTEGEFGILLSNIVDPVSQAIFSWNRWASSSGRRVAVLDYRIDEQHSTLTLGLSDLAKATLSYHGSIYADSEDGSVLRITSESSSIPEVIQTKSISTIIDYDAVQIAGRRYLLPSRAQVWVVTESNNIRNEMLFQNYKKFEAESTITFSSATPPDNTKAASTSDSKVPQP